MPDIRDAMNRAGLAQPGPPRSSKPAPSRGAPGSELFPQGYPDYFNSDGVVRTEYITTLARRLADRFGQNGLKRHQLRAFYDHAKRQLQRLDAGCPFPAVLAELTRLRPIAYDRANRSENALPKLFQEFLDRNLAAVSNERSFRGGFMRHFEAVVAYCATLRNQ